MPLPERFQFFVTGGSIESDRTDFWVYSIDQRRIITVSVDEEREDFQEDEEKAMDAVRGHIDTLADDVTMIRIDLETGDLLSVSTDPVDDMTEWVYYPSPDLARRPDGLQTILRSELRELDRFTPCVDLVSYQASEGVDADEAQERKGVFKYYWNSGLIEKSWADLHFCMALSHHPNIVPVDRLVLDEVAGNIVGYTTVYIPGGTLQDNVTRPFKLKWLRQLTQVVDDLNLKYGVAHQDLVPRNLLIDEASDNLMVFDFNWAAQIGNVRGSSENRDDVRAVAYTIYEIITRDLHYRDTTWEELSLNTILDMDEWTPHPDVVLDHPVAEYRAVLNAWLKARETGPRIAVYTDAPEYIDWPELEKLTVESDQGDGTTKQIRSWNTTLVRLARKEGRSIVKWQRPAANKLTGEDHLLANGELVAKA
ncbi:hypothetical protein B0J18DRAFT_462149 [Chaetomium sp. MPI-SDFR-AT-0129]|nr:hypothetical protein B0J18DRAFT_462149 [Chaetomium sp. MPI-SDFR-AT-0129]